MHRPQPPTHSTNGARYIICNHFLVIMSNPLYSTEDWKKLDPTYRFQLMLVLENVKPGTIIGGDWGPFQRIVRDAGLVYVPTSRKYALRLSARVAHPEVLDAYMGEQLAIAQPTIDQYHRIAGKFLGYPTCCVEEYVRDRTPEERQAMKNGNREHSYTFGRELETCIQETGTYPDVFDYRAPSFTPCSVNCENARALLTTYKNIVETNDPEAAEAILRFHRQSYPQRGAHTEFWRDQESKHTSPDYSVLHQWLSGEHNGWFHRRHLHQRTPC